MTKREVIRGTAILALALQVGVAHAAPAAKPSKSPAATARKIEKATFGGGCFWSLDAIFDRLKGVESVSSGFSGGNVPNPDYRLVCTGKTGHAEAVQIRFDSSQISYRDLLNVLFSFHDPTTLNRQGADVGTQYRSAIFYHSPEQRDQANQVIAELGKGKTFGDPIVTQVVPYQSFFAAEDYHQAYYDKNSTNGYCENVITPKVAKLRKLYGDRLKPSM